MDFVQKTTLKGDFFSVAKNRLKSRGTVMKGFDRGTVTILQDFRKHHVDNLLTSCSFQIGLTIALVSL